MTEPIPLDPSTAVGQIARFYPATIPLLEAMDVEFANKGARPLRDAAIAAGIAPDELFAAVQRAIGDAPPAGEESIAALVESLVADHRALDDPFRETFLRLQAADGEPELPRIRRLIGAVRATLAAHMVREERDLFMRIEALDLHPHTVRPGSLSQPLLVEFVEHDTVAGWLVKVRELVLRLRARGSDPALLDAIDAWDRAFHRHLHAENNVLIPRVLDLEHRLKADRASGGYPAVVI